MDAPKRPKPLNILALDGGGVRGLSSLLILRNLMQNLRTKFDLKADPLPCEVFDLICGTSTGGLIALMLGRLRMSVDEAIDSYTDFSKEIFGQKVPNAWYKRLLGEAMYDATNMEKCVKRIVEKHGGGEDALLKDPRAERKEDYCYTFVVAVTRAYADAPPNRFRSYATKSRPADTCKIWEAARATTAASTFFDPMTFGRPPQTYIDGAFSGANNPSQIARDEASHLFPGRPIGCFLSLGTGVPDVVSISGSLANIAKACATLLTSCEGVDNAVGKEFRKATTDGQLNPYFRFSVNRGLKNIMLDEWNREEELTGVTNQYMEFDDQEEKAKRCVEVLKSRVAEVKAREEDIKTREEEEAQAQALL